MSGIALDKCSLLSLFVESVLWGIFLLLSFLTIYLLSQKRSKTLKHIPHILGVATMLALCTMHLGLNFRREMHAFFLAPSPVAYLEDAATQNSRFRSSVHLIQIFMTDLLIVSRSFLLWDKNYHIAIFPCLLVAGTLVAGIGSLVAMSSAESVSYMELQLQPWMIAVLALTLTTKAVCLCLVSFRVRQIHTLLTSHVNRHISVYTLLVVMVESGAVAFLACLALLPMFVSKRNAHHIVLDALSPIMGITFTTIIAGMTVNLASSTNPTVSIPRSRHSIAPLPRPPIPPKAQWNEYKDEFDVPTSAPSSPTMSRPTSLNLKSTGTLNVGIVL